MPIKFIKRNWKKIALAWAALIFLAILAIGILINLYGAHIMSRKIKATIIASTDSLYSVRYSNLGLRIFERKIIIDQIELIPNLDVYNRRKKVNLAPNSLYTLQVKRLIIDNIQVGY